MNVTKEDQIYRLVITGGERDGGRGKIKVWN